MKPRVALTALFGAILASRLCHLGVLWTEEDLPLAAAVQMLFGKVLFRDIWFDKPPLVSSIYLLWGAETGWPLRIAGSIFIWLACYLAYRFARDVWGEREGLTAAALLAFFLIFSIPSAVIPLAADLLMLVPHLAAVYYAWRGRALWSGIFAGLALLFNSKALYVLAVCAIWQPRGIPLLMAGFALPNAVALAWMALHGSLADYLAQAWSYGMMYARNTFVPNPVSNGIVRTLNWAGFHATLVVGAVWFWARDSKAGRRKLAVWLIISAVAVITGWRFFPRYFFQILPVFVIVASRGLWLMGRRARMVTALLLLVPFIRFGPRYVLLARDLAAGRQTEWKDVSMDRDSKEAANAVSALARPGDTLFVWGYRPDIYAYTRMPAGTRFLESQPLNGVYADRHLTDSVAVMGDLPERNRRELAMSRPTFVLDGLAPYNPGLAITNYADLRPWLENYEMVKRTRSVLIYRRR